MSVMVAASDPPVSIVLVDGDAATRTWLRRLLEQLPALRVTGEAATAAAALNLLRAEPPRLLLLDTHLPDQSGLDLAGLVRREWPAVSLVFVTRCADAHTLLAALRAGATGFLLRNAFTAELATAITSILAGRLYVSTAFAQQALLELVASGGA